MNWFGFGFNGFGQIAAADGIGQMKCKVSTPVLLSDMSGSDCKVSGSWSSRAALIHTHCGSHVCVSGFVCASSGRVFVTESQGCMNASISERCLTLGFTDREECWQIQQPHNKLLWRREKDPSDNSGNTRLKDNAVVTVQQIDGIVTMYVTAGHDVSLPLVSGGYVMPRPPFFRPLCSKLCAVSLALGTEHAVLLTAAGTVYTWGSGSHGQLGHGDLTSRDDPQVVEALWGVSITSVSAGGWHSASVSAGGDLYMWGWNKNGQLGLPSKTLKEEKRRRRGAGNIVKKEEKSKDEVFISIQAFPALVDVPQVSEITRVACGSRHTSAITGTGDLYTWGWGYYGQLGHDTEDSTDEPALVQYFHTHDMCVTDVVCGLWNTFVSAVPKEQTSRKHTLAE